MTAEIKVIGLCFQREGDFHQNDTMLSILEYLYNNSQEAPVSKFNIVAHTPGIKRQRPDRVNLMMDSLQSNYFIMAVKFSNTTFYKITEKGIIEYTKWIKNFLEFAKEGAMINRWYNNTESIINLWIRLNQSLLRCWWLQTQILQFQ